VGRALSFYHASSVIVAQPDTGDELERGAVGSNFEIPDTLIAFSGSLSKKQGKRTSLHVAIAPPPVKEDRQVQRIRRKPSRWVRLQLWFNTYRWVPSA
jgi:hypothetical protein